MRQTVLGLRFPKMRLIIRKSTKTAITFLPEKIIGCNLNYLNINNRLKLSDFFIQKIQNKIVPPTHKTINRK